MAAVSSSSSIYYYLNGWIASLRMRRAGLPVDLLWISSSPQIIVLLHQFWFAGVQSELVLSSFEMLHPAHIEAVVARFGVAGRYDWINRPGQWLLLGRRLCFACRLWLLLLSFRPPFGSRKWSKEGAPATCIAGDKLKKTALHFPVLVVNLPRDPRVHTDNKGYLDIFVRQCIGGPGQVWWWCWALLRGNASICNWDLTLTAKKTSHLFASPAHLISSPRFIFVSNESNPQRQNNIKKTLFVWTATTLIYRDKIL